MLIIALNKHGESQVDIEKPRQSNKVSKKPFFKINAESLAK